MDLYDCIIIGGGPAGLNAAVVLGRCRRSVLVFDSGQYRNLHSHGMHNFLTRDGILPTDFLKLAQEELQKYSVQLIRKRITKAKKIDDSYFEVKDEFNTCWYARKLLIATGVQDTLPKQPGFAECYGQSVFHCPYCDAWEYRDQKMGVYAREKNGWELALALKGWTPHVTYFTGGGTKLKEAHREALLDQDIVIVEEPVLSLSHENGKLNGICLKGRDPYPLDALFFVNGYRQTCDIAETFGCKMSRKGVIITNRYQQTDIEGLFVAGDASRDMHFVVVAAAEGAKAGVIINKELNKTKLEDGVHRLLSGTGTAKER